MKAAQAQTSAGRKVIQVASKLAKMASNATLLVIFILASFFILSTAHFNPCSESFHLLTTKKKNLTDCTKLTTLAAEFGWKINNDNDHQMDIIFGTRLNLEVGWLAWGVNPDNMPHMVGTRAIIGIRNSTGDMIIDTYNITADTKLGCKLEPASFAGVPDDVHFQNISMDYDAELKYYTIQARVVLPAAGYNMSRLNHVWQVGYEAEGKVPKMHSKTLQNVDSTETINLKARKSHHVGAHRHQLRAVHGILAIVGWGALLPTGVIVARYFKYPLESFQTWLFRIHLFCQITGYTVGTVSWTIGLALGQLSKFYIFKTHRLYAIFIFAFTTLQMLAIRLRPEHNDEYRKYWNMYHHFLGYALLVVISINMFHGIGILKPYDDIWKGAYVSIISAFAAIVALLEIYTWVKFKFRSRNDEKTVQQGGTATTAGPSTSTPPSHD